MNWIVNATTGIAAIAVLVGSTVADAATTTRPPYGCFKVTADALNIRARPYSTSKIVGHAGKGDILIKRKRYCTWRGFWCAVQRGTVEGYADKSLMKVAPCPPSLSAPTGK